jgi:hypothetical protein
LPVWLYRASCGIQESREGFRGTGEYRLIGLGFIQKLHTGLCVRAGGWAQQDYISLQVTREPMQTGAGSLI